MSAHDGTAAADTGTGTTTTTQTSDLVTLIITTSPTPSAPSTDLISDILASFKSHCPALLSCRVIVVLDTYDRVGPHMRLKKGQITAEGARAVEQYKRNVKDLILREWCPCPHIADASSQSQGSEEQVFVRGESLAEYGSPHLAENHVTLATLRTANGRVTFIEPAGRLGFGLAVRSALRAAETPLVWVQQHDWPLVRAIPLRSLVAIMQASEAGDGGGADGRPPVKYVCLPAVRMLSYATSAHVMPFPALRALTAELKRDFVVPAPTSTSTSTSTSAPDDGVVPLTPLFFWHDKPHLASTAHYLARVFPSRLALARGDFIEDTVGQRARAQMKDGNWAKWACWLYCPADGRVACLQHRHGRRWRGVEADARSRALFEGEKEGIRRGEQIAQEKLSSKIDKYDSEGLDGEEGEGELGLGIE
ncbi:hypothetical protein F5Y14DRAFT_424590 [Nemania sp. NC0429]|nr:hypothetical protein F5Y14DRAFT_424590 [Nemania sp. NC0429]